MPGRFLRRPAARAVCRAEYPALMQRDVQDSRKYPAGLATPARVPNAHTVPWRRQEAIIRPRASGFRLYAHAVALHASPFFMARKKSGISAIRAFFMAAKNSPRRGASRARIVRQIAIRASKHVSRRCFTVCGWHIDPHTIRTPKSGRTPNRVCCPKVADSTGCAGVRLASRALRTPATLTGVRGFPPLKGETRTPGAACSFRQVVMLLIVWPCLTPD